MSKILGGLPIKELAARTWDETLEDNLLGRAAELAYYFLLALFPMLIFLTSLVGFIEGAQANIFSAMARVVPGEAMRLVDETIRDVVSKRSGGLLSFGVLAALWAGSGGVSAVMETLTATYDVKEERSYWKLRLLAILITVLLAVLLVGGVILIMFGDKLSVQLAERLGLGPAFKVFWGAVDYLLGLALLFSALEVIYFFGPNVKQDWRWITPGAVFAVALMIVASILFSLYLRFGPSYSATYGGLGAVIVLLLWLYLMALIVLVGSEINAEIAHAAGKQTPQKVG